MPDTNPSPLSPVIPGSPTPLSFASSHPETDARPKIHVILQNKGGIGKTLVSVYLIAFLRDCRNQVVQAVDLDPMNHSLAEFPGILAKSVDLFVEDHSELKGQEIDDLAELMLTANASFVIDNGAAGFVRFGGYLADTDFAGLLTERNRDLILHTVVAGGDMTPQCILGLHTLLTSFPEQIKVVVWLNEHTGPVEIDGIGFSAMKIYRDNKARMAGLVHLPRLSSLFLRDFNEMVRRRLTFGEAIGSPDFHIMNKQRLIMTRRAVWDQLEAIL